MPCDLDDQCSQGQLALTINKTATGTARWEVVVVVVVEE